MPRTAVLIPSYNSWSNLEQHLPRLLEELEGTGVEVVISDDASPDDTVAKLREHFPSVRVLERASNGGFGENCNTGVEALEGVDRVLLLNSDVHVLPGFLAPLEAAMGEDVFAVSAVAVEGDRVVDGARHGEVRRGLLRWRKIDPGSFEGAHESLYPVGAHVLIDRARFLELGGFDPLYRPFYWEDVDLGYRAWKRGWRVLIEPASRVEHRREGSDIVRIHGEDSVDRTNVRNRMLFHWANFHDGGLFWGKHLLPVLLHALVGWITLDRRFYRALLDALGRRGEALQARRRNRGQATVSDRAVLERLERSSGLG